MIINCEGITITPGSNCGENGSIYLKGDKDNGIITVMTGTNLSGRNIATLFWGNAEQYPDDNVRVIVVPANVQADSVNGKGESCCGQGFELNANTLSENNVYEFFYSVYRIIEPQ